MNYRLYERQDSSGSFSDDLSSCSSNSSFFEDESFCRDSVVGKASKFQRARNNNTAIYSGDSSDEDESFCQDSVVAATCHKLTLPMRRQPCSLGTSTADESESCSDDEEESYCRDSIVKGRLCRRVVKKNGLPKEENMIPGMHESATNASTVQESSRRAPPLTLLQLSKSLYVSSLSLNGSSSHNKTRKEKNFSDSLDCDDEDDFSDFSGSDIADHCVLPSSSKDAYTATATSLVLTYMEPMTHLGPRAA